MRTTLLCLLFCTASVMRADDTPNPAEVHILGINHSGTGCRDGTVASSLSADAKVFTLLFSEYVVDGSLGDPAQAQKACRINVRMHVPPGWSFSLFSLDYRGYANLPAGTRGVERTRYTFGDVQAVDIGKYRVDGPFSNDYFNRTLTELQSLVWSSCNDKKEVLKIDTNVHVTGRGLMTVDSVDGTLKHVYGILWKRCGASPGRRVAGAH